MTHKTRTILFLVLLILFLIAAPLTVLYCLGWRFDWEKKSFFQPGMFYLKAWPKNCQVYINDEQIEKTDFFFGSILIENLMPKKYNVEIKKEGFHSWIKILEAKNGEVAEAKNIVLIPKNPDFKQITRGVKLFFFSPDEKKIILKEEELSSGKTVWSLKLFEIDKNVKSQLINEEDILENAELLGLKFSPDSKKILLKIGLKEKVNYYLLEIDKTPLVLTSLGLLEKPEEFFLPSPLKKEVVALNISGDDVYYLDDSGFLFKNEVKLNLIPHEIKKETKYEITASGSNILLQEDNILYIFNQDTKSFQKLFEPIKNFRFSPDSQKLAYFTDYEIWVLFLEKNNEQPQKEADDQLFITRFSEKIDDVFWYTNHYLIFNSGDKIKIAELDDRDKINIVDLAEFSSVAKNYGGSSEAFGEGGKNPEIFWSNKKLYLLSEETLYVSAELTP